MTFRYESTYWPAWLCLPPAITACIYEAFCKTQKLYDTIAALDDSAPHEAWQQNDAQKAIDDLVGSLERVNVSQIIRILDDAPDETLTPYLEELMFVPRVYIREAILNHIKNPRPENTLVAKPT